jgi:hypothetical protein
MTTHRATTARSVTGVRRTSGTAPHGAEHSLRLRLLVPGTGDGLSRLHRATEVPLLVPGRGDGLSRVHKGTAER